MQPGIHVFISVVLLLLTSAQSKETFEFPGDHFLWSAYSDEKAGGKSENYGVQFSDSSVHWSFQLKNNENHVWPFLGISKKLAQNEKMNFGENDTLIVEMNCTVELNCILRLCTFDPERTIPNDFLSFRCLECPASATNKRQQIAIPLSHFRVADWWKRHFSVPADDNRMFLDAINRIDLVVNNPVYVDMTCSMELFTIDIRRQHSHKSLLFALLLIIPVSILPVCYFKRKKLYVQQPEKEHLPIKPAAVQVPPSEWERVISYIQCNYMEPELDMSKVAEALCFSKSKLSHLINQHYTDGFRGLIHELRITEGKRLLNESSMNISEIAYKLGYATPNHFNREFKKRTTLSPSAYRKSSGDTTKTFT